MRSLQSGKQSGDPSSLQRGFTLVELLVVFALLALVVSVIPPALEKMRVGMDYRHTVQDITRLLRRARFDATTQGQPVTVAFNTQQRSYGLVGQAAHSLPETLDMQLQTAAEANLADGSQSIVFLPGGGATGGSITLLRQTQPPTGLRLRVDWLSGLVSQEQP
ncbi:GspH/FimT family pseudopilin [Comamonas denitrificans]|jgi:general secretion pathway protein H|uniref:GspH/FimT family pseudopilin n=1 Tax=Comamonas denitrificans TaxID=117506 RepID=UPI00360823A0